MRLYNGCPDDELQAVWDEHNRLLARLKELEPEARCTYYPMEGMYIVFGKGFEFLTDMIDGKASALRAGIAVLEKRQQGEVV